jgi:cell division protein FtsL
METKPNIFNYRQTKVILTVIGLYAAFQIVRHIAWLTGAGDRITQAQQQLDELKKENQQLQSEQKDVDNPQFIERAAREKLSMGRPGEFILVIPQDEIKKLADVIRNDYELPVSPKPGLQPWEQWWKLFTD